MSAVRTETLKKLVLSRPVAGEIQKISGRLCAHRGKRLLALEFSLPGNTVSHKNIPEADIEAELPAFIEAYRQANLITTLGDAELKVSKGGKITLLGYKTLSDRLAGDTPSFERAIESLDNKKSYILSGNEDFLIKLGVSDKTGRVHDKKQGKFRQINRFLEHIELIYPNLPKEREINVFDLCCGKSYLSFAVYHYLTAIKGRKVKMLGIDLKRDVIDWCSALAKELGYVGMTFITDDINNTPKDAPVDMVISLHACDIATDVVLDTAIRLGAGVILSTPCCHRYLNDKISCEQLSFITDHPHLRSKLCEVITDAIRTERLKANGYSVCALELTDPDATPKNTLIRAIKTRGVQSDLDRYDAILDFILGGGKADYLSEIK